jgi:hypothetical protein
MTDPIDTARADGIALGIAMARKIADEIQAIAVAAAGKSVGVARSYGAGYDAGERAVIHHFTVELEAIAPIPPHVAAARVLLERMDPDFWGVNALAAQWLLYPDADALMGAIRAALQQIAGGE